MENYSEPLEFQKSFLYQSESGLTRIHLRVFAPIPSNIGVYIYPRKFIFPSGARRL
jgi:hypothetical protein